ncbi:cytochrome b-c1 complex subunit 9 [Vespa crabro]|uniref:cytochrome b-c1 complex subunit 9 n=1 Tax=Vespa crabro TaxID=7445 RepID=UPI001F0302EB|nr:cytochrome b-c1 complex subunit 9 [Vespa crabro]
MESIKKKKDMVRRLLYRYIFKRTSTYVLGIVVTSIFFERTYDYLCESIFELINDGRLWAHIKHQYENPPLVENVENKKLSPGLQDDLKKEVSVGKKID